MQYTDFVNPNLRFLGEVIRLANIADLSAEKAAPKRVEVQNPPPLVPDFDEVVAEKFREYRPCYMVANQLVKTRLYKVCPSPRDGEMVAYYNLEAVNPASGQMEITTFLYAIRDGEFKELKKFDPRPCR